MDPNDNGWFITNNLVSGRIARYEEIRDLVKENIQHEDIQVDSETLKVMKITQNAQNQGLDKERIRAWFNATEDGDKLIADLLKIGPLD